MQKVQTKTHEMDVLEDEPSGSRSRSHQYSLHILDRTDYAKPKLIFFLMKGPRVFIANENFYHTPPIKIKQCERASVDNYPGH
jgi:hypothetical protein